MTQIPEGYEPWGGDLAEHYEDLIGPFYVKKCDDGTWKSAFYSEKKHLNGHGNLHGGLMMSFADTALFAIAREHLGEAAVTVSFNCDFVSAGSANCLIEASGEIVKATRSLLFVRGRVYSGDDTLLSFSGILKKLRRS
ncbi:thioesterase [Kordiimonas sediminis]|uniref:Thioesterase n=1 Tax=Kordiimonas sediminis TaxID=1735581 RepID=A0A919E7Y0_9PROT|nr:PaaI family thioesterase [Kordiimonas sediminis]GHF23669.1 thioesterase [Kordiimonas sediminis]